MKIKMKTPDEFYSECLNGFITIAQGFGYANLGPRGNEVLTKRAEQSVRELLKYKPMIKVFGNDPMMYYYHINGLAFAMGIVLAMLQLNAPQAVLDAHQAEIDGILASLQLGELSHIPPQPTTPTVDR